MRILALLLWAAACTGSPNYMRVYTPASGTSSQTKATALQHAAVAITDAGREIESSDAGTGMTLTKWFSGDSFNADDMRFRVRVTVDDASHFDVVALCQRKTMSGAWEDCGDDKRPQFVIDLVARVAAGLK